MEGGEASSVELWIGAWQLADLEAAKSAAQALLCSLSQGGLLEHSAHDLAVVTVALPQLTWTSEGNASAVDSSGPSDDRYDSIVSALGITSLPTLVITDGHSDTHVAHPLCVTGNLDQEINDGDPSLEAGRRHYELFELLQAATSFYEILGKNRHHAISHFNLACILHTSSRSMLAMGHLLQVLLQSPQDHVAHTLLWSIASNLASSSSRSAAISIYEQLVARNGDVQAQMRLAALTNLGQYAAVGHSEYIRQVFNHLADSFETKLVKHLGYQAPWHLFRQVTSYCHSLRDRQASSCSTGSDDATRLAAMTNWRVLDLGCGSGLCAKVFQDVFPAPTVAFRCKDPENSVLTTLRTMAAMQAAHGWLVGVDLSERMVDIARGLQLYHALIAGEVMDVLSAVRQASLQCELILSADTFIYMGSLGRVFAAVVEALVPGGLFAFSTEDLESSSCLEGNAPLVKPPSDDHVWSEGEPVGAVAGWGVRLSRSVRYAHSHAYIFALSKRYGMEILQAEQQTLRSEEGTPILGFMYLLRKL